MKVILQQSIQKLGKAGDVVEASPGYFRNFLQPRKLAVLATDGTLKKRQEDLEMLRKKAEALHQSAVELGEKVSALGNIRLTVKTGEGGKLYGKITNKEIAQELEKQLGIAVDKRVVRSTDHISALGTYRVVIKLTPEVQSEITVEVQPEGYVPPEKTEPRQLVAASAGAADQTSDGEPVSDSEEE